PSFISLLYFFSLLIPRPPTSTLFPYTTLFRSHDILFPNVRVEEGAMVENSLLFEGVTVGEGAQLRRCIVDKHVAIPAGEQIGFEDRKSTRLNSSHSQISYAVFCLKKKKKKKKK